MWTSGIRILGMRLKKDYGVTGTIQPHQSCPRGKIIGAASVRYEDPIGRGDNTVLNGLALWCVDKSWQNGEVKIAHQGFWGNGNLGHTG